MAGPLQKWIDKLKSLQPELERRLDSVIDMNLEGMADLQRERLNEGKGSDGGPLKRDDGRFKYTPEYVKRKAKLGLQTSKIDLKVSGDFHDGITVKRVGRNMIHIYSKDKKNRFLTSQYPGAFGFDEKRVKKLKKLFSEGIKFQIYTHFHIK